MCVYSMIMDHFDDKWRSPPYQPYPLPNILPISLPIPEKQLTDEEIIEFRKLLDRAKEYDERTGQKDCELENKKDRLKKLINQLGQELEDL